MPGRINGFSLGYTAAGAVVLWSGIKGTTISDTFRGLLKGQPPAADQEPIQGSGASAGTTVTGGAAAASAVASTALKYTGSRYAWGGAPGTAPGVDDGTDCSGFVNMVVGRDLKMPIPGYAAGTYTGAAHGPTSQLWLLWNGARTIPRAQAAAGDLACWLTHIGFFTDSGQHVVSSLDTQSGVVETTLAGASPTGEPLTVRRLKG